MSCQKTFTKETDDLEFDFALCHGEFPINEYKYCICRL